MIERKKEFYGGAAMMVGFIAVLIVMFMPIFYGQNALNYLDALFNSISKGSAFYVPNLREEVQLFMNDRVEATLAMPNAARAEQSVLLFEKAGASVTATDTSLNVSGDLGQILSNALADAEAVYYNKGEQIQEKYGFEARRVLYNWWSALNALEDALNRQERFKEAKVAANVRAKAVETAFNYYQIEPQKISDRWGIVIFALVFYVVYTLWYGFAIMFMFEGWGLDLEH
ncbi:MAG TPA: hypothetical protein ACFCUC_13220 [Desulfobacterales bacterium]